jgi:hypothetical protein
MVVVFRVRQVFSNNVTILYRLSKAAQKRPDKLAQRGKSGSFKYKAEI